MNSNEMIWIDLPSLESFTLGNYALHNTLELCLRNIDYFEAVEIVSDRFESVKAFRIDGLNRLKTLKIGNNSFTQVKQADWKRLSYDEAVQKCKLPKSFHILNCESLESIEIGEYSFSDFGGDLELKNLPKLQSIKFDKNNFFASSFMIRGIVIA